MRRVLLGALLAVIAWACAPARAGKPTDHFTRAIPEAGDDHTVVADKCRLNATSVRLTENGAALDGVTILCTGRDNGDLVLRSVEALDATGKARPVKIRRVPLTHYNGQREADAEPRGFVIRNTQPSVLIEFTVETEPVRSPARRLRVTFAQIVDAVPVELAIPFGPATAEEIKAAQPPPPPKLSPACAALEACCQAWARVPDAENARACHDIAVSGNDFGGDICASTLQRYAAGGPAECARRAKKRSGPTAR